jgi:hypothetical protein
VVRAIDDDHIDRSAPRVELGSGLSVDCAAARIAPCAVAISSASVSTHAIGLEARDVFSMRRIIGEFSAVTSLASTSVETVGTRSYT